MYKNRYNFWNENKNNLIKIDKSFESFSEFEKNYFLNSNGINKFFNLIRDKFNFSETIDDVYKRFTCDLPWAKKTSYCLSTKYSSDWSNYSCVVKYAEENNGLIDENGGYRIGDITYYANGRMWDEKRKNTFNYQCDGDVPKEITTSQPTMPDKQKSKYPIPSELANVNGIKKFQDWLDKNHPGWHTSYGTLNQNIEHGYGTYGPRTNKNWNIYKNDYLSVNPQTPPRKDMIEEMKNFPQCVWGLHNITYGNETAFVGSATDANNEKYTVFYFKKHPDTPTPGKLCYIRSKNYVSSPIRGIYWCEGGYISIKNLDNDYQINLTGSTNAKIEESKMENNLKSIVKESLIKTKENKKRQLQESKIIDTRFKIIVETENIKSQDELDEVLIDILFEMVYLHNQGFDDKLIAESVEGVFGVLTNLFKGGASSILDTFKEKGVAYIIKHLGFDGNTYLENFLITAIGNTSLSDVPKLFTDCKFLTKRIAETIPEAYLRKLEYDKGMGSVFMDAVRNSLYDVIRNSDFADRIESSIAGVVCPLVDKMSGSFAKKLGNMKSSLVGNTQVQ